MNQEQKIYQPQEEEKEQKQRGLVNKKIPTFLAITIIAVLAIVVGGGALLGWYYWIPREEVELPIEVEVIKEEFTTVLDRPGSLVVSDVSNKIPEAVSYGRRNVDIFRFNLSADTTEDIELFGIAIQFYSRLYGEELDRFALRNMRLIDEYGNIYALSDGLSFLQEIAPDRSWAYKTTYTWFNGEDVIQKGTTRTFSLVADIPSDSLLSAVHAVLPSGIRVPESAFGGGISAYFKAVGSNSRQQPNITGSARGVVYLRPQNSIGSIVVSHDPLFPSVYSRSSKEVILSKINISAGIEEDISVSKIAMRISNFVPGQFKNVKLVKENGIQYGATIENPLEVEGLNPNLFFFGDERVGAGESLALDLIADVDIPSAKESKYGIQLQREVIIPVLTSQNYSKWIIAKGIISGEEVYVFGAVSAWPKFTD